MLKHQLLLAISLLMLSQSFLFGQTKQLSIYEDAAAYEVYSAVLSFPEIIQQSKAKNLIIRRETFKNFGAFLDTESASTKAIIMCCRKKTENGFV